MIDMDDLDARQAAKLQAIIDLQAVDATGPEGETLADFTTRINGMFEAAAPATEDSGIVVGNYP